MSVRTLTGCLLGALVLAGCSVSGCGKRSAGREADPAGKLRDAAAKSRRLTVSIATNGHQFRLVSTTMNRAVIGEVARAIRVNPEMHHHGLSGDFQLEFENGDDLLLEVYYYDGYLGSPLWEGEYEMTDEACAFLRGFLLGAGVVILEAESPKPLGDSWKHKALVIPETQRSLAK